MQRRELITLIGGAAVTWPLAARAQQPAMKRVGVLIGFGSGPDDVQARETLRLFRGAMEGAGWIEDKNVVVDYRYGAGNLATINAAAGELVSLSPDLIYALGLPAAQALREKTRTIPIVFSRVADPVGYGLVSSLNHPGGNVTGFTVWDLSIGGKWMQLLLEIAPELRRVGVLYNPDTGQYARPLISFAKTAAGNSIALIDCPAHNSKDIEAAAEMLGTDPHGGLLVIPEPFTNARSDEIISLTLRFGLPTLMSFADATKRGALISYFYAFAWSIQQPVSYIDRILKGQAPGDLPVQAPTKYELSINLKTAKTLGLTAPPSLLTTADEVIE